MTNTEFVENLLKVLTMKTLYVKGGFGHPLNAKNKERVIKAYTYNKNHADMINKADASTFAFDCCGLVKGVAGGFTGNKNKVYGGDVVTKKNGVLYHGDCPDYNETGLLNICKEVSTNFATIEVGEFVYMNGHCGVYVGDNRVIECTPSWSNGVQLTGLGNNGVVYNGKSRVWLKHGKLPFLTYKTSTPKPITKTNEEVAKEVIQGKWGNGIARKKALEKAGYNYQTIQGIVNRMLRGN